MLRISLLAGEMRSMHLSSSGALLSGAASIRLYQLVASVLTLLFTTSAIVCLQSLSKASLLYCGWSRSLLHVCHAPNKCLPLQCLSAQL